MSDRNKNDEASSQEARDPVDNAEDNLDRRAPDGRNINPRARFTDRERLNIAREVIAHYERMDRDREGVVENDYMDQEDDIVPARWGQDQDRRRRYLYWQEQGFTGVEFWNQEVRWLHQEQQDECREVQRLHQDQEAQWEAQLQDLERYRPQPLVEPNSPQSPVYSEWSEIYSPIYSSQSDSGEGCD